MAKKRKTSWDFHPRLPDGSRVHYRFKTSEARKEFIEKFNRERDQIKYGLQVTMEAPTIAQYAVTWLNKREKTIIDNKITAGGWQSNERHFRLHIIPLIGNVPIDQLTPEMIENMIEALKEKGQSPASRNRIRGTLHAFYNDKTIRKQFNIRYNPVDDVEKEDEDTSRPEKTIIQDPQDAVRWLEEAYKISPMFGCLETLLLNAGPRKSQVIPLRWQDYDEALRRLWMGRMWEASTRSIRERTKGRKKNESFHVGVNDLLAEALADWKSLSPWTKPSDYIFSLNGDYLDPSSIDDRHNRIRKTLGIDMTFHEGRHTYGSHFISLGGRLEDAQAQLGHKSKDTTEKIYKHSIRKDMRSLANVVSLGAGGTRSASGTKNAPNAQGEIDANANKTGGENP
jgi:integrase